MRKSSVQFICVVVMVILILQAPVHVLASGEVEGDAQAAIQLVRDLMPKSLQMVDAAIDTLSNGLAGLNVEEKEEFLRYFDPGATGEIDEDFVTTVADNFEEIRRRLNDGLVLVYAKSHRLCVDQRLFVTDFTKVFICPYIFEETDTRRIARDLIHEMMHIAFHVLDRAYYLDLDANYDELTPRGYPSAQIPIVGPLLREIARADTLYHPDAYGMYAAEAFSTKSR